MATIKSYTDPSQSRTLSKILPFESADGGWYETNNPLAANTKYLLYTKYTEKAALPAWSLAALFDVLPERAIDICYVPNFQKENGKYSIAYGDEELLCVADNPVDACYEMILKLNELKLL